MASATPTSSSSGASGAVRHRRRADAGERSPTERSSRALAAGCALVGLTETVANRRTSHLHGTVSIDGRPASRVLVTAEDEGEIHRTVSRSDGGYAFDKLHPAAAYTIAVDDEVVRRDIALTAGEDGWHSEDFALSL